MWTRPEDQVSVLDVSYVLQLHPTMRLEQVSDSVVDFTGYTAEQYLAQPLLWLRAVDPRDRGIMLASFNAPLGEVTTIDVRFMTKDRTSVWTHQVARTVRRSDGAVVLHGGLCRIAPRDSSSAPDHRYQAVAEGAADVLLETDRSGKILWVSDSIEKAAGWKPSGLLGTPATDLLVDQDRSVAEGIHMRVLTGESVSGVVLRMRTLDGNVRFISTTARPATGEEGSVTGSIVGWRDVDEVVRAHRVAEGERLLLRATIDSQIDPLVLVEAVRDATDEVVDFRFLEVNVAACRFIGLERDALLGRTVSGVDPAFPGSEEVDRFLEGLDAGRAVVVNDLSQHLRDGRMSRFDVRAVPVDDGLAITWRDSTQRYERERELAASEDHYRVLFEQISDIVTFHDLAGNVEWVSPAFERLLGWPVDKVIGESRRDLVHPDDLPGMLDITRRLVDGADSVTARARLLHRDGSYRWMESTARAVRGPEGQAVSMVVVTRDIQEQVEAQRALTASEARYRLLAEHATDVAYQVSVDGTTQWISDGVEEILGLTPEEVIGTSGFDIVVEEDHGQIAEVTQEALTGRRTSARFRVYTRNRDVRWIEATLHPVFDDSGAPVAIVGGWRDVQAEVDAQEALNARVRTDDLTGLVNRREVLAQLDEALDSPEGTRIAVAFCDIDGFKAINDSRGHAVGDRLLLAVAQRIGACVRSADVVARVGGDEILLMLPGVRTLDDAMLIAEKVRAAVKMPLQIDGQEISTSISIGVTLAVDGDDVDTLVARADRAMYLAKQAGRDQVVQIS